MTASFGHNEARTRLGLLAEDARKGLARVAGGEATAIEGWIIYGHALNEGRALFPGDREFGQWVEQNVHSQLARAPSYDDRAAAMWAAANPEQFEEAKALGAARTVRGIHAQWLEVERQRQREAQQAEREARAAETRKAAERAWQEQEKARQEAQQAQSAAEREAAEARALEATRASTTAEAKARAAEVLLEPQEVRDEVCSRPDTNITLVDMNREELEIALAEAQATARDEAERRRRAEDQVEDLKAIIAAITETDENGRYYARLLVRAESLQFHKEEAERQRDTLQWQIERLQSRIKSLESAGSCA